MAYRDRLAPQLSQPNYGPGHVRDPKELRINETYEEVRIVNGSSVASRLIRILSVDIPKGNKKPGAMVVEWMDVNDKRKRWYQSVFSLADKGLRPHTHGMWTAGVYLRRRQAR